MDMLELFTWLLTMSMVLADGDMPECKQKINYGMKIADCSGLSLTSIPSSLDTETEILELSHNRIRVIYNDSLQHYQFLKYLYLRDNFLSYVEDGAFDTLQDLQVVDFTDNSLDVVPAGVLKLSKLRKLYISNNRLLSSGGFEDAPTIETLEYLSLGNCHLQKLPPLHMFPNLKELNVSNNKLKIITPEQLSHFCQLQLLDLRDNPFLFKDTEECECLSLSSWIRQRKIYLIEIPLNCTTESKNATDCVSEHKISTEQFKCRTTIVPIEKKTNVWIAWVLPFVIVAACMYIVILLIVTKIQDQKSAKIKMEQIFEKKNAEV